MSYRSLGSDEVTLRNYRPVGRRKGNMSLSDPLAVGLRDRATSSRSSPGERPPAGISRAALNLRGSAASGLLRSLLRRAVAPFRHEQIEFRLVLGLAQACRSLQSSTS
jgi:hypothetical protein